MSDLILDLLRSRVPSDKVKYVSAVKGGEWASPCPKCGGDDRFRCWPSQDGGKVAVEAGVSGTWWCRQCDKTGDAIGLLMFADGLEFKAACKELRIELKETGRRLRPLCEPRQEAPWQPTEWAVPSEKWRNQATKLARDAHEQLLQFPRGLDYLAGRGIALAAVRQYGLGFLNAEDRKTGKCLYRARSAFGLPDKKNADGTKTKRVLWIPRGFTIPQWWPSWSDKQEVLRIRIRRPKGDLQSEDDPKYMMLNGSGQAPMALGPVDRTPGLTVWVVVEAELDAIAVHHACGAHIGVISVRTNRGKPDVGIHKLLVQAPLILVALDFDRPDSNGRRPGFQGWEWWQKQYTQAKRWPVPVGKDPGDAFREGIDLAEWVSAALPSALAFRKTGSLGFRGTGSPSSGAGELKASASDSPEGGSRPAQPKPPLRWPGARADTPLEEAVLPEQCRYGVAYLREYYAGRMLNDELLLPCPKGQNPWWWGYYKACRKCGGHRECLVNFLTSPQMLAPAAGAENDHAH